MEFFHLHEEFEVGKECESLVVVGDQKTYEHMQNVIRTMPDKYAWVRPYPGMWHMLLRGDMAHPQLGTIQRRWTC